MSLGDKVSADNSTTRARVEAREIQLNLSIYRRADKIESYLERTHYYSKRDTQREFVLLERLGEKKKSWCPEINIDKRQE